jgi:hypothetical protein
VRFLVVLALGACAAREPRVASPTVDLAALPSPHREDPTAGAIQSPVDLRGQVGRRDPRSSIAAALAWTGELGMHLQVDSAAELVAWAEHAGRVYSATEPPQPGDLLVLDRGVVAIAVARDARGITELVYVAGGVVRRGFLDAARPTLHRDPDGTTVNTFLRHGKRSTPKRYLTGAQLAHVIRVR